MSTVWTVGSDHHAFWVGTQDWGYAEDRTRIPIGGLLLAFSGRLGAYVITKVHTGLVNVEVQYHTARPHLDFGAWEDSDLVLIESPLGDLCILPIFGYGDFIDSIVPGPGTYAVCCSSNGRDTAADDHEAEPPVEFYRFDIWPAAAGDGNTSLKQTSAWGKEALATFRE
ncbi:MAG TPA: hypothetical protein PKE40_08780 [Arachnia sp.]|nr:hypothetical protein [Arachnia sp.]HMT86432.1 hypothetical protein [Arachnia sp.]